MNFNTKRALSPVIVSLLLIVVAVVAALVVFALLTGLIGGLADNSKVVCEVVHTVGSTTTYLIDGSTTHTFVSNATVTTSTYTNLKWYGCP
jgi:ABC-type phosphate transport system substrate-binding protein